MNHPNLNRGILVLGAVMYLVGGVHRATAVDLVVTGVEPARHALAAPVDTPITVHFDKPVKPESVVAWQSFWAFGRWSGTVAGSFSFSNSDQTVTLTPDRPFSGGETVMVILSHDIEATDGTTLRPGGYSFQFWTAAKYSPMTFEQNGQLTTRTTPEQHSQAYGGFASDLDGDGFLDITIVNEITEDLRVFMNHADHSGTFDPFIQPTFPVGDRASPSEPSDFNRDGIVDVCVANIDDSTVSILLGNGDGTFAPQQLVAVGTTPRGIAVLDVDGDGDTDVVNTNTGSNNMSVLLNDGNGVFGPPTFFEGGGTREWALAAADMNDDGLLDLVIGARLSDNTILVDLANGDGTFTHASTQSAGGSVWMLVCGDVNGDGAEDVATANSQTNRGAILLGDGAGNLAAPTLYVTDPFPLATDLGDLDGDGDLDWVTSSYAGDWFLFRNNGAGLFSFVQEFPAPEASSCSLMLDIDNDRDVDLALIDEEADVVIIMQNDGYNPVPAASTWGLVCLTAMLLASGTLAVRRRHAGA
ncbi:MAG: FG-GAP-like repeat-containing protein [Phycisphaerae bacterium]|jgi:hypothetical protein